MDNNAFLFGAMAFALGFFLADRRGAKKCRRILNEMGQPATIPGPDTPLGRVPQYYSIWPLTPDVDKLKQLGPYYNVW